MSTTQPLWHPSTPIAHRPNRLEFQPKAAVLIDPITRVAEEIRKTISDRVNKVTKPKANMPNRGVAMRRNWADPVMRAKMLAAPYKSKRGRKPGRPGYSADTLDEWNAKFIKAKKETKIIMDKLIAAELISDDDQAKAAMAVAVEIMLQPIAVRDRLQAARTVLEYTKQKPGSKTDEAAVGAAEKFLAALAAKS